MGLRGHRITETQLLSESEYTQINKVEMTLSDLHRSMRIPIICAQIHTDGNATMGARVDWNFKTLPYSPFTYTSTKFFGITQTLEQLWKKAISKQTCTSKRLISDQMVN